MICRFCFTKLNNLDKHMISAEEIKSDLLNIYNRTNNIFSVKIEEEEPESEEENTNVIVEEPHPSYVIQEQFIKEEYEMVEEPEVEETVFVLEDVHDEMTIKCEPEEDQDCVLENTPEIAKEAIQSEEMLKTLVKEIEDESLEPIVIDGERAYRCKICDKILMKNAHAKRHIVVHKNERTFQCEFCSSTFNFHGTLMQHRKTHDETLRWTW
jgi:hypothetical protein